MLKGGVNLSQDNAVFSFELNESLYFEQGQEVAEIRGISLDPEISIQPFNDYISIRGVIELKGEYQRAEAGEKSEEETIDLDDYSTRRYVEQVLDAERGGATGATFSHRFPVEISVPTYRVNDLNDVTVSVDYFDYEIPDQNQIRLKSIIAIQGINDVAEIPKEQEYDEVLGEEDVVSMEENDTFRFDIKKPEEDITGKEQEIIDDNEHEEVVTEKLDLTPLTFDESSADTNAEQVEEKPSYSPSSFIKFTEDKESQQTQAREEKLIEEDVVEEVEELKSAPKSSVKSSVDKEAEQPSGEKIDYLSDMFRQDEERYSKMKVCIVQDTDTIDTISQKYRVNPLHISKQNHLEDEEISEGQLLFIPDK